jgi:hypothetical protein
MGSDVLLILIISLAPVFSFGNDSKLQEKGNIPAYLQGEQIWAIFWGAIIYFLKFFKYVIKEHEIFWLLFSW